MERRNKKRLCSLGGLFLLVGISAFLISTYSFSQPGSEEEGLEESPAAGSELQEVTENTEITVKEEADLEFTEEPLEVSTEELKLEVTGDLEFIEIQKAFKEEETGIKDEMVNLIFKEANVTDVLAALAQQTGMNIIWGQEVGGVITLRLENVPWEQALNMVLRANKLTYEREKNVIRVTTLARLNEEKEALLKLEEAEKEKEPLVTEIISLNFSDAEETKKSLQKVLSKRGSVVVNSRTNSLVITEIPSNFPKVKKVAESIDTQTPQVMIEARIVETSVTLVRDLGIDWAVKGTKFVPTHYKGAELDPILDKLLGAGADEDERRTKRLEISHKGGSFDSQFPTTGAYDGTTGYGGLFRLGILDAYDFEIAWQSLQSDTGTKILSNPRVATLHSKEAYIVVGEKIPIQTSEVTETGTEYTVEYEDVGTKLTVKATINKEDMVTLKIQPEVSEIGEWVQLSTGSYPTIKTKEADVEVLVQSGDTVVIGGLIYEKNIKTTSKIPILGDIPIIGWAFKKQKTDKEDQEILVFVTPTVFGKKEKEKIAKELINFEDEKVELIDKEEGIKEEKEAFREIEKELEDLEKEEETQEKIIAEEKLERKLYDEQEEPVGDFEENETNVLFETEDQGDPESLEGEENIEPPVSQIESPFEE